MSKLGPLARLQRASGGNRLSAQYQKEKQTHVQAQVPRPFQATVLLERALDAKQPGPFQVEAAIAAVHHAFALARADGAASGLALLDANELVDVSKYPYVHLVRGTLLGELGRIEEARTSLALASQHARNAHERTQIRARLHQLETAQ